MKTVPLDTHHPAGSTPADEHHHHHIRPIADWLFSMFGVGYKKVVGYEKGI
jgi:hypothetical protein